MPPMRRPSCALACALSLVIVPSAAAHVIFSPTAARPGEVVRIALTTPNERDDTAVVGLDVEAPAGITLDQAETKLGWTAHVGPTRISWRGGRIPAGQFTIFSLTLTGEQTGTFPLRMRELFADGSSAAYVQPFLVRAGEAATPGRDSGARDLGKAALFLAIAAVVLAAGAGFLGLWLWLRPPPRDAA